MNDPVDSHLMTPDIVFDASLKKRLHMSGDTEGFDGDEELEKAYHEY